jgi:hypothetical protein
LPDHGQGVSADGAIGEIYKIKPRRLVHIILRDLLGFFIMNSIHFVCPDHPIGRIRVFYYGCTGRNDEQGHFVGFRICSHVKGEFINEYHGFKAHSP